MEAAESGSLGLLEQILAYELTLDIAVDEVTNLVYFGHL
jgi:hypothetical protein